ncbi:MAG: ATP-binding protein [Planctomycetota bacterium]
MVPHPHGSPASGPGRFARTWVLHEQRDSVERLQSEVAEALGSQGFGEAAAFAIRLALEEALVNGFRHGNRGDPSKQVTVECAIDADEVCIEVIDQGEGFDPGSVPDPTAEENIEIPSGRGIMLMRAYMTSVEYLPPGNRLRIVYRRDAQA